MSEISRLSPVKVWEIFDLICSVPHISGHEKALAEKLAATAKAAGLAAEIDGFGNVRIVRPACPGWEKAPKMILQGHLDMVPACDGAFDFIHTPITPYIDGEWVRARGTTLGADDGIGVAHAMAILLDRDLHCGELTGIFTTGEETGMTGAANIAPEWLDGRYMLNLDAGSGGFCIGCAGGKRQEFTFTAKSEAAGAGFPVKITISGLPGGHSGVCIHLNRGNAIKFLAEFLDRQPDIAISSFDAGSVDNAIPANASACGVSKIAPDELQKSADAFIMLIKKECPAAKNAVISLEKTDMPRTVWSETFRNEIISALALCPDGMTEFYDEFNIARTSTNLARVRTFPDRVEVCTSQRGMDDRRRDDIGEMVRAHFEIFHGAAKQGNVYPSTRPESSSPLLASAVEYAKKCGISHAVYATHGGLETGWFSSKNPNLEILSCGPDHQDYHTPREKLNIGSVAKFDRFLRELLTGMAG